MPPKIRVIFAAAIAFLVLAGVVMARVVPHMLRHPLLLATQGTEGRADFAGLRKAFKTAIQVPSDDRRPAPVPPPAIFVKISYNSAVGPLGAYLTPDPKDGRKHPAIVWITGGDCNSIGEMWLPAPRDNDQSATAFRKAGIVLMAPSLRGGNDNPGTKEGFAGEIDGVLAAADFLAAQPYIDPARIYLGGHSTGGTLALLTGEASNRFRAVFAFGPADEARYHRQFQTTDFAKLDPRESRFRAPAYWLASASGPVFVLEGGTSPSNIGDLTRMQRATTNPNIRFVPVRGATHFTILAPVTEIIAQKILQDTGPQMNIQLSEAELSSLF